MISAVLLCVQLAAPAQDPSAPRRVVVGAYVQDIQDVDVRHHAYAADIYLWFRWTGAGDPSTDMEFMNAYDLWGHTRKAEWETPVEVTPGEFYQVVRVQGRFSSKFDLKGYPFDRHELVIEFEDAHAPASAMQYVPDGNAVTLNPHLVLPGWMVGTPTLAVTALLHPTRFGDPREGSDKAFSRVRIGIPVRRPAATYAAKLVLPLLCVVLCALLMFLFSPRHVDARVGLGMTSLLTLVALQITLNDDLPDVEYLVLMDELYMASYMIVIASLAVAVATTRMLDAGQEDRARRWDRIALGALTAVGAVALIARALAG